MSPDPDAVRAACASVDDPEFGLSIDDLGLIYDVAIGTNGHVDVAMTLTTPTCPAGNVIVAAVQAAVTRVPGVSTCAVRLVWEPGWNPALISARGREHLGWI